MALAKAPAGSPASEALLLRSMVTLISSGTERMLLEFGKANWIDKARQQPDKVRMVLDKIRTDGVDRHIRIRPRKARPTHRARLFKRWCGSRSGSGSVRASKWATE